MKSFSIIFVFSALIAIVLASISKDGDVLVITEENFDEALETYTEGMLIEFYAPWCGHCKSLAPEWAKAATSLKDSTFKLAKVDATENRNLAETFGIKGFPTIKYFKNKKFHADYSGGRKSSDIVTWALKKSGPAYTTLNTVSELESFQDKNEVFALGALSDLELAGAKIFLSIAGDDERIPYAVTTSSEVKAKLGVTKDTVIIFKDFDEKRSDLELNNLIVMDQLAKFVVGESTPLVQTFTSENAKKIFASPIQKHILFFTDPEADHHEPVMSAVVNPAKAHRGKVLFINVPPSETKIAEFFGVTAEKLPIMYVAEMTQTGLVKYLFTGDLTSSDEIGEFMEGYTNGELKPSLKSEDPTPEDTAGPVVVLRGTTFEDIVIKNTKDVLVEFYAPWCGHCKKLAPIFDSLGEKFQDNENIVIAKMDATANEVIIPGVAVQGYPTLFWFAGNNKGNPVKVDARELSELISFVETHSSTSNDSTDSTESTGSDEL